jgi:2-phospho-L-lactate guanylyltransferase
VIIAVKRLEMAKTTLAQAFPPDCRALLVQAMVQDTIGAALATPAVECVIVVTPDATVSRVACAQGAEALIDPTPIWNSDPLNSAIRAAEATVRSRLRNVAVLQGDLPALRSTELSDAVSAAHAYPRSFVTDRHGTGTAALFAFGVPLRPTFGRDSALRHFQSGAFRLDGDWPGLRCDVDTVDEIRTALGLGVAPFTLRAVRDGNNRSAAGTRGAIGTKPVPICASSLKDEAAYDICRKCFGRGLQFNKYDGVLIVHSRTH